MEGVRPYPEICKRCGLDNPTPDHWKWNAGPKYRYGGTWKCREAVREYGRRYMTKLRADPERSATSEARQKAYYAKNPEYQRYKAYRCIDRKRGYPGEIISWPDARPIMLAPCSYCGVPRGGSLDRIDNTRGHSGGNVQSCCSNCNLVLSDMPIELKRLLAPALTQARQEGLFDIWQHPRLR